MDQKVVKQLLQLKKGVQDMLAELPNHSHMRRPLLHFIAHHLPVKVAAQWFNVNPSTIKAARALSPQTLNAGLIFVERFVAETQYVISCCVLCSNICLDF